MAVVEQQVERLPEHVQLAAGGEVGEGMAESTTAAAKLHTSPEQGSGDEIFCTKSGEASVPGIGDKEVVKEESHLYEEWRERERKILQYLEDVTSNPQVQQERLLEHILKKNANSTYLRQFGLNGATDVDTFRQLVPVSDYDNISHLVTRIVEGDKDPILSGDPVVEILASTGTTGGESKLYPITQEDKNLRVLIWSMMRPVLNQHLPGLDQGKCMFFYFILSGSKTVGGLTRRAAVTSFIQSEGFRERPFDPTYRLVSPDAVIEADSYDESTYCHLICGLLQRKEVLRIGALFASGLVRPIRNLEEWWPEICEDLAKGSLSESRVKNDLVRASVQPYLRADLELAQFVRKECESKNWGGIIKRLWPNCKVVDTVVTGTMEPYTPILCHYSGGLPVICTQLYAASEGYFGINLNPLCRPEEITYNLLPSMAYYEFIHVPADGVEDDGKILDLTSVKEGEEYEILVTTVSGLCRYKIGDVLKVVGFHNATPTFRFMRRKNTLLSVDSEKTDEQELHLGVTRACKLLEDNLDLRLQDYTSTVDLWTVPPHYVIFMELRSDEHKQPPETIPFELLEKCCEKVEMSFSVLYRRNRFNKLIGSLELRIVKEGTFERVSDLAFTRGCSPAQYKTPRGLGPRHSALLEVVIDGVIQSHSCQSCPPLPSGFRNFYKK